MKTFLEATNPRPGLLLSLRCHPADGLVQSVDTGFGDLDVWDKGDWRERWTVEHVKENESHAIDIHPRQIIGGDLGWIHAGGVECVGCGEFDDEARLCGLARQTELQQDACAVQDGCKHVFFLGSDRQGVIFWGHVVKNKMGARSHMSILFLKSRWITEEIPIMEKKTTDGPVRIHVDQNIG